MMQWQSAGSVVETLHVVFQASSIDSLDAAKLTALVQNAQRSDEEDDLDAPGVLLLCIKVAAVPLWRLWRT